MFDILQQHPQFGWMIISGLVVVVGFLIRGKIKNVDEKVLQLECNDEERKEENHKLELQITEMNTCIVEKIDGLKEFVGDRFVSKEQNEFQYKTILKAINGGKK